MSLLQAAFFSKNWMYSETETSCHWTSSTGGIDFSPTEGVVRGLAWVSRYVRLDLASRVNEL